MHDDVISLNIGAKAPNIELHVELHSGKMSEVVEN